MQEQREYKLFFKTSLMAVRILRYLAFLFLLFVSIHCIHNILIRKV